MQNQSLYIYLFHHARHFLKINNQYLFFSLPSPLSTTNLNQLEHATHHELTLLFLSLLIFIIAVEGISSAACSSSLGDPLWADKCMRPARPAFHRIMGDARKEDGICPCTVLVINDADNATGWSGMRDSMYLRTAFFRNTTVPALPPLPKSIKWLKIEQGGVADISALRGLDNLGQLQLSGNPLLGDVSSLQNLTSMYVGRAIPFAIGPSMNCARV